MESRRYKLGVYDIDVYKILTINGWQYLQSIEQAFNIAEIKVPFGSPECMKILKEAAKSDTIVKNNQKTLAKLNLAREEKTEINIEITVRDDLHLVSLKTFNSIIFYGALINKSIQARSVLSAMMQGSLDRYANEYHGRKVSEEDYNKALDQRLISQDLDNEVARWWTQLPAEKQAEYLTKHDCIYIEEIITRAYNMLRTITDSKAYESLVIRVMRKYNLAPIEAVEEAIKRLS
jgi:hypothetical protein